MIPTFSRASRDLVRLAQVFGHRFAAEFTHWSHLSGMRVRLADPPRTQRGGTGAIVAVVEFTPLSGRGPQTRQIVKVYPDGDPAGDHPDAFADVPADFAERHLVRESSRHRTPSGRCFAFQEIHFDLSEAFPLALVAPQHRPAVAANAAELVLLGLNEDHRIGTAPAHHFLRAELRGALDPGHEVRAWADRAGLLDPQARWITIEGDDPYRILPNPVAMAVDGFLLEDHELSYLIGFSHGDYHQGNILARVDAHGTLHLTDTRMIDLNGFRAGAPLSRDIATLALSLVKDVVCGPLRPGDDVDLIDLLLNPENLAVRPQVAPYAVDAVRGVYRAFRGMPACFQDLWRPQYLLSTVAQALIHTSYEDAGPDGQWWYARLAAHAADEFRQVRSAPANPDLTRIRRIVRPSTKVPSQNRRDPAGRHEEAAAAVETEATGLTGRLTVAVDRLADKQQADDLRTRSRLPKQLVADLDTLLTRMTLPRLEPDGGLAWRMAVHSRHQKARSSLESLRRLVEQTGAGNGLGSDQTGLLTRAAQEIRTNVAELFDVLGRGRTDG